VAKLVLFLWHGKCSLLVDMDIARPDLKQKKKRQMFVWAGVALIVIAIAVVVVARLKPAAPPVDRSAIWTDTVKRGPMIRQVRGSTGTLVPREDSILLIPALTEATVVRIRVLPGAKVTPDTILLDLADPQLNQQLLSAKLAQQQAQADYKSLQSQLQSTLMDKKTTAAQVDADYATDKTQADTDAQLCKLGVISGLVCGASKNKFEQLAQQKKISMEQLEVNEKAIEIQLASSQSKIDQAKTLVDLYEKQTAALEVKAGIGGEVAALPIPMQVGAHVAAGTPVAEVIQLDKLKAALQIAETQAHDIQLGQPSSVDTHNGIVPGHVSRIDPTVLNGTRTVDVQLDGPLPPGAVPNLSVDGTIDLERMADVLQVGRPALGNENSTLSLFKVDSDGKYAVRVPVKVGRASVNTIQVMDGLKEGDTVILSDMSRYDNVDRVRLE
jgi:RND family efflux transporter MFP subunit